MKTNTVKMKHHPLASLGLKLPLTALERQGISPDSNQALSLYTLKIWLGIPLSPAIEMQELHLHLLFHSTEGTAPPAQYIEAPALKKKKKRLPPILMSSRGSLVEGQIELEQRMDDTHFKQRPHSQSSVTLAYE